MVWCAGCKRPHSYLKWTCSRNVQWQSCILHRPVRVDTNSNQGSSVQRSSDKPVSASSSAARPNVIEPHSASRLILSSGLATRFPHLVGAPMDSSHDLPSVCRQPNLTRIDNHTIHEEPPPADHETACAPPVAAASSVSSVAGVPVTNSPLISNVVAGEGTTKKKSKPFRKVHYKGGAKKGLSLPYPQLAPPFSECEKIVPK